MRVCLWDAQEFECVSSEPGDPDHICAQWDQIRDCSLYPQCSWDMTEQKCVQGSDADTPLPRPLPQRPPQPGFKPPQRPPQPPFQPPGDGGISPFPFPIPPPPRNGPPSYRNYPAIFRISTKPLSFKLIKILLLISF